jgi:chromosome segregation ATPase
LADTIPPAKHANESVLPAIAESLSRLGADLRSLLDGLTSETLRTGVRSDVLAQVDPAIREQNAALREREAALRELLSSAQTTQGRTETRLDALSEDVLAKRIEDAVEVAARRLSSALVRDEVQPQVEKIEKAYEDLEGHLDRMQAYIEVYEPGGMPVLLQRVKRTEEERDRLVEELRDAKERVADLDSRLTEEQCRRARRVFEGGIDPEVLERRVVELTERERALDAANALAAQNQRLRHDLDTIQAELGVWRERDLGVQRVEQDVRTVAQANRERDDAHSACEAAEGRLQSERTKSTRHFERATRLERELAILEADRKTIDDLREQLEALAESHSLSARGKVEAETAAERRAQERDHALDRCRGLQDELHELKQERRTQEVTWKAEESARTRAQVEAMKRDWEAWAADEASVRAARSEASAKRLAAELEDARVAERERDQLRAEVHIAKVERAECERSLVDRRARLEDEHRLGLEQLRARSESTLEAERIRVREEALSDVERLKRNLEKDVSGLEASRERVRKGLSDAEAARTSLQQESVALAARKEQLQAEVEGLLRQVDDLRVKVVPDEERLAQLHAPVFSNDSFGPLESESLKEADWLRGLQGRIADAGFTFHPRLVRAFHTSLKIAEQAPLTVLAGISGTGKSELPRLYADLGGLPFLELAVQPSWDSPHDLFGFFNYTDGRVKAEELSRVLFQMSQDGDRLREGPMIVLLDEMNLARVEYYFADLLSKLEARRSVRRLDDAATRHRASVHLDAGPGRAKVPLYLDERVLFVGTMNEDESTLTLSDKVLDRSCVLTFPAPRDMSLKKQGESKRHPKRLSWDAWRSWHRGGREGPVAERLNEINKLMERIERPFGHRLFHAIHSYIENYPQAEDGEQAAWSDQFAMKIAPRLRGLECGDRGVADTLNELATLVPDELGDAFERSRKQEFFRWAGAPELYRVDG